MSELCQDRRSQEGIADEPVELRSLRCAEELLELRGDALRDARVHVPEVRDGGARVGQRLEVRRRAELRLGPHLNTRGTVGHNSGVPSLIFQNVQSYFSETKVQVMQEFGSIIWNSVPVQVVSQLHTEIEICAFLCFDSTALSVNMCRWQGKAVHPAVPVRNGQIGNAEIGRSNGEIVIGNLELNNLSYSVVSLEH